ncbi:unnamed protein product [Alopecurus aequalis]
MDDPDPDSSDLLRVATVIPSLRLATVTASLGPVGPLLRQLRSLTPWPNGVSEAEIQILTKDLERLCVSLMDHSEAEEPSSTDMCWMSEIRELCYDIKTYFDDSPFIIASREKKQKKAQLKFMLLKVRVSHASERSKMHTFVPRVIKKANFFSMGQWRRLPVLDLELIDRALVENIGKKLMDTAEEKQPKAVVSLVGPEGVGKTTLAKWLYHQIGGQFQCRAFVRVSANPDVKMLLSSIFTQIQLPGLSKTACCLDVQHLIKNIKLYLGGKRYLIIIDDLWSITVWDIIRRAFPDECHHSRVVTATQFEDVASACCNYKPGYIINMEPLNGCQSRKLLLSGVLGSEDHARCSEDHLRVSDEIISKCGGSPLLIVNVSSILPTPSETNLQMWKDIRDSLPSTQRMNPSSEGIKEVVNFLYNNLSQELKTCLLYFALYPEGYTVEKDDLVKLWVVEGFAGEGQNKEEIALEYFDELVSRGMIQAVDVNNGEILSCTLHHLVHDLVAKKSMEENFIIGVDYFQSDIWLPDIVRRLSVQFGGAKSARIPTGIMLSEVRSLAFFGFYGCTDFIENCRLLRILTLHVWADDCGRQSKERIWISPFQQKNELTYDLAGISKFLHLRYLKIASNIVVKLPGQIRALRCLETLEIDATVVAIPSDIGRLSRLFSLKIALREFSRKDICILRALPALTALSLRVWAYPVKMIFFDKGEFSALKSFKFRCSVPLLKFIEGAMPDLQNVDLCFNAHEADQRGIVPIGIEHLQGLKEITATIWGADTDVGSTFRTAMINHPSSPIFNVQLIDRIFHGEDEKKQDADSSMSTLPQSERVSLLLGSSVLVQGGGGGLSQSERVPHGGGSSLGTEGGFYAASQVVFVRGDPISVPWKDDNANTDPDKMVKKMSTEDCSMSAEEDPEEIQRKIVESASRKGKTKIGSSEKEEAASMDISSSGGQTERYNLHPLQSFSRHYNTNMRYLSKSSDRAIDHKRGAMGSVLDKLGKLVTEDYNLGRGVEIEIESFSEDLMHMHDDVAMLETLDEADVWVDQVRELSYNIEDMVDSFLVHVEPDSNNSAFRELKYVGIKLLVNGVPTQIDDVIRNIKNHVQIVADRKKKYKINLNKVIPNAITIAPRISDIYIDREHLIGIEEPRNELIELINEYDNVSKLKIFSIVGMGGLGKTVLAKAVYDKLQAHHDIKAFVPVGRNPDLKKVLRYIISEIEKEVGQNPDMVTDVRNIISGFEKDVNVCKRKIRAVNTLKKKKATNDRRKKWRKKKGVNARKREKVVDASENKKDVNAEDMKGVYAPKRGKDSDASEDKKDVSAEYMNLHQLTRKIKELLHDKRYFLFIDDLWNASDWNVIRLAFPENKNGSIVITTTRIHDVAFATCNYERKYIYMIKPLNAVDSRRLFFGRIFGPREDCPDTLVNISIDILKKCGGMPLAINSIASMLAGEPKATWEHVWKSLGALTDGITDLDQMKQILELSYIHLPDHLKTCLLYFCMYPEDREIDKNDLLRKWEAEGFVHVSTYSGLDAEDVAEEYFNELLNMCMIQPGKIDCNNEVLSCRVHDIVLDFLRSMSSKENFIHVTDGSKDLSGHIHRVSVQYNDKEDSRILERIKGSLSHARSVMLYGGSLLPEFQKYQYIRVVHLEREIYSEDLLDLTGLGRLFLLRYLKIAFPGSELKLPNQIGELQQLETIDVQSGKLQNYPSDIVSLPWLSHLVYAGGRIVLPDGIAMLKKSLRTLVGVCVYTSSIENIKGLGELTNLRRLQICSNPSDEGTSMRMDALHSSICKLSASLRILSLGQGSNAILDVSLWKSSIFPPGSNIQELDLRSCNFQSCPKWISQLHHLYKLRIWVREVADGLTIVGRLPSLAYFQLYTAGTDTKEESVVISGGTFQALKHLIFSCPRTSLTFQAGAMPQLEKLEILFRYHMDPRYLPVGIMHLPAHTLKEICLRMDTSDRLEEFPDCSDEDVLLDFFNSEEYVGKSVEDRRRFRTMLRRAFEPHHPGAHIVVYFGKEEKNDEDYESGDDEEDYEDDYELGTSSWTS